MTNLECAQGLARGLLAAAAAGGGASGASAAMAVVAGGRASQRPRAGGGGGDNSGALDDEDDDELAALADDPIALAERLRAAESAARTLVSKASALPLGWRAAKRLDPGAVVYPIEGHYDCVVRQTMPASGMRISRTTRSAAVCLGPEHAPATVPTRDLEVMNET